MFDTYSIAQLLSKKWIRISTPIFAYENTGIYSGIQIPLKKTLHSGDDNNNYSICYPRYFSYLISNPYNNPWDRW